MGHIISGENNQMDFEKVNATLTWPQPKNYKSSWGFKIMLRLLFAKIVVSMTEQSKEKWKHFQCREPQTRG